MTGPARPFNAILDDLKATGDADSVSAGDILATFEHRSLGVLLTVFALIASLPVIGGIPGVSVVTGTLILLAVGQSTLGGGTLWMPAAVRRRTIARATFDSGIERARPWVARVDGMLQHRLTGLIAGPLQRALVAGAAALLAITFYPLALVPFGVTAPALAVLALGLGLLSGDGLMVLLGYAGAAVTAYGIYALIL